MKIKPTARLSLPLSSALAAMLAAPSAHAADFLWDGGTANWNTANEWSSDAAGTNTAAIPGINDDTSFNITSANASGNTISMAGGNRAAKSLTFSTSGATNFRAGGAGTSVSILTVGAGGITANPGAGAVTIGQTPASFGTISVALSTNQTWTNNSASALTTIGPVTGSGVLTKDGTGTVALSGAGTYSGGTTITSGRLIAQGNNAALGTGTVDVGASGILRVNHNITAGTSLAIANTITGSGPLEFSGSSAPATAARRLTTVGSLTGFTGPINVLTNGNYLANSANATTNQNLTIATGGYYTIAENNGFGKLDGAGTVMRNAGTSTTRILTLGNGDATGGVFSGTIIGNTTAANSGPFNSSGLISVTKVGSGTQTLSGANIYAGDTLIQGGTLALAGTGVINGTTGITINGTGAKFLQTSSVTSTPGITLTEGTLDGTGTVGAVSVADLAANKITNGNLDGSSALTVGSLTLGGEVTFDIRTAGSAGVIVAGILTTLPANGNAVVNVTSAPAWITGNTYNLISYDSLSGVLGDFTMGTITGLGGRQVPSLVLNGNNLALLIGGDSVRWTGAASTAWTTTVVGTPFNWITAPGGVGTEFMTTDDVIFNDLASGVGPVTVDISGADVSPNTVIFSNDNRAYTISGSNGIATGTLIKSGAAAVTLATANTYTGGTLIQNGSIVLRGGDDRLLTTGTVTLGDVATTGKLVLGDATTASNQTFAGLITTGLGGSVVGGNATTDSVLTLTNANAFDGTLGGGGTNENNLALNKTGSSNITLSGTNTYSGGTTLASGILTVANNSALGTGPLALSGGQRLVVNDGLTISNNITIGTNSGFIGRGLIENSGSGNATLSGGTITVNNTAAAGGHFAAVSTGSLTIGSVINSAATTLLWRRGTGTFSGGGSYSNFTIGEGTVGLGATNGLSTSATVEIATSDPGNFDLAGFNQQLVGITKLSTKAGRIGNSSTTADSTLTVTGTSTFAGVIQDVLGSGTRKLALTVNGGALTLSGVNTYTGGTLVSAGTLVLADNAQLKFVLGADSGINNSISGAGTVTLEGDFVIDTSAADALASGTWTLENVSTLTGEYGANFTVIGFTDAGGNKWTKAIAGGKTYTFDETTGTLTLAQPGFSAWITGTFANGTVPEDKRGPNDDPDNDGISNLVEYAIADQDPTVPNPTIGTFTGTSLSFAKRADASGLTYAIEESTDLGLADIWAEVTHNPPTSPYVNDATTISHTFTPGTPAKDFFHLKVTQTTP